MTGLHDPLCYGVVIVMNTALYFCPNKHVFKRLSSLVGYNWGIFKYVFQQRLILYSVQFCINIFLRLCTDGWYVVTKGKICLRVFFFCCGADCLFAKLTSDNVVCSISWGYRRVMRPDLKFDTFIERCF